MNNKILTGRTIASICARGGSKGLPGKNTRLFAGRTLIHVLADARPDESFMPVDPGLEDVYFTTLTRARARAETVRVA